MSRQIKIPDADCRLLSDAGELSHPEYRSDLNVVLPDPLSVDARLPHHGRDSYAVQTKGCSPLGIRDFVRTTSRRVAAETATGESPVVVGR